MKTYRHLAITSTLFLSLWTGHISLNQAQEQEPKFMTAAERTSTIIDLEILEEQAQSGDVRSQLRLGSMYRNGTTVARNTQRAFYWFLQAAKSGHVLAQLRVAKMFQEGIGIDKNDKVFIDFFSNFFSYSFV